MANLKRNMIELVKEVKEGEIVTKNYLTPIFIPLSIVYEALDLLDELGKKEVTEKERLDKLVDFVSDKVYKGQFSNEELKNEFHAPDGIGSLQEQVLFITRGYQNEETKKYLAKKN